MTRKTPEAREQRREAVRSAAEEDARSMLLAAGIVPGEGDEAAVQALLGEPVTSRLAYSVQEFCAMLDLSASTFYRARREGRGPKVVSILGLPRILAEEAQRWVLANCSVIKPSGLARAREEFAARQHELPGISQQVKARKPRRARLRSPEPESDPTRKESAWDGRPMPAFLKD